VCRFSTVISSRKAAAAAGRLRRDAQRHYDGNPRIDTVPIGAAQRRGPENGELQARSCATKRAAESLRARGAFLDARAAPSPPASGGRADPSSSESGRRQEPSGGIQQPQRLLVDLDFLRIERDPGTPGEAFIA
jgi:hypothetical protein